MTLPAALYDTDAVRALDAAAISIDGVSGLSLMTRAGQASMRVLRAYWPRCRRVAVYCGQGNNAGDGYVLARSAVDTGMEVRVVQVGDPDRLSGDAKTCYDAMLAAGVEPEPFRQADDIAADVVIDAMLGTGITRDVEGSFAAAIERLNGASSPVLSIDVPSGINATTGRRMGVAVVAAVTVTFIGAKQGLFTGDGPAHTGVIEFDDLNVPSSTYQMVGPTARRLDFALATNPLGRRSATAHKGNHGHVLIIGGVPGYSGAARLAGEAAARVGAGLVSVATDPRSAPMLNVSRPELMVHAVTSADDLGELLARAKVVAIGPGLGQSAWALAMLGRIRAVKQPVVIDADALTLLAADPERHAGWVMTPHPGEAARLLDSTTADVQGDRFRAALRLRERYGGVVVLKGAGTVVLGGGKPAVITDGNPGMATGGMGDVLTGVVAGLLAQGLGPEEAAQFGAVVHAHAADLAAKEGERGLLPLDLMPHLRRLVNDER
jgi:NAD(P)H-hydrate epimerase